MRAGNPEIAARKPTASPRISNGGDIPDRTSVHSSRTPDAGNRREVAMRLAADLVFKPDPRKGNGAAPQNPQKLGF